MSTPYVIQCMMDQIGRDLAGGLCYVGASEFTYNYPRDVATDREVRPCQRSAADSETGTVATEISLRFRVNTQRRVYIMVSYEPDDTYTVRLWRATKPTERLATGKMGEVLAEREDVHGEDLQCVVERLYDEYIRQHQQGCICLN